MSAWWALLERNRLIVGYMTILFYLYSLLLQFDWELWIGYLSILVSSVQYCFTHHLFDISALLGIVSLYRIAQHMKWWRSGRAWALYSRDLCSNPESTLLGVKICCTWKVHMMSSVSAIIVCVCMFRVYFDVDIKAI